MCHAFTLPASFFAHLLEIDNELAEISRAGGCPWCGGVVHSAAYRRKPRGVHRSHLGDDYALRHSFCCAEDGCRRRCTPPSVRFLGRRVYVGFLLVLTCSVSVGRLVAMGSLLSVPVRTIRRWRAWWQQQFSQLPGWRTLRLQLSEPVDSSQLPDALWARFGPPAPSTLTALLRQISPLVHPGAGVMVEG
jgi:hypothetical protein